MPGRALRAVQQLARMLPQGMSRVNTEIVLRWLSRHEYRTASRIICDNPSGSGRT
jgi:hypothetical protein